MKASDLRIGNYVGNGKVTMTNLKYIEFSQGFYAVVENLSVKRSDEDEILPILINEEWLLKFGWDRESESISLPDSDALIVSENNCSSVRLMNTTGDYLSKSFNCVHELQNLYFGLTGEELEFKK